MNAGHGMSAIVSRVEVPHVVYPKGPTRKIASYSYARDEIAGEILIAVLECGHPVTIVMIAPALLKSAEDPDPAGQDVVVRCPVCFYEAHKGSEEIIEPFVIPLDRSASNL